MTFFLVVLAAYLIGSVPFALIFSRFAGGVDPREIGSRNPGAANVLRTAGFTAGIVVAVLDAAKGAAGVLLAAPLGGPVAAPVAGVATIVGHVYPIWFRFRGGKGVATACGVFLVLAPLALLPALALFVVGVWLTSYISIGSLLASAALPPLAYAAGSPASEVAAAIAAAVLIAFRHRTNLLRVIAGTEPELASRTPAGTEPREL
jgi:glycerol-3-phosphate acyltransferase PlsY